MVAFVEVPLCFVSPGSISSALGKHEIASVQTIAIGEARTIAATRRKDELERGAT